MPPIIHGQGLGRIDNTNLFDPDPHSQLLIGSVMNAGQAQVIGEGVCDYVHIEDLMMFYELFLVALLEESKPIPFHAKGILFSFTNRSSWKALSRCIAELASELAL